MSSNNRPNGAWNHSTKWVPIARNLLRLDLIKGVFDLGTLIRYLYHNDAYPGAEWGHPSDNLGALISVSDWLGRQKQFGETRCPDKRREFNIRTLLTAQIKAYEIQGVLQISNAFNEHGIDHTVLVKVASTALVSCLLGLSENEALAALSQSMARRPCLTNFSTNS
jgi:2-methylcitrate dehydratase